jgi:hypothetical protein
LRRLKNFIKSFKNYSYILKRMGTHYQRHLIRWERYDSKWIKRRNKRTSTIKTIIHNRKRNKDKTFSKMTCNKVMTNIKIKSIKIETKTIMMGTMKTTNRI